jgi:hypothetical protein
MKYFMRVASICQVIFVEIIATACMASVFANILGMFMLFGCEKIGKIDGYFIFSLLLGIFCLYLFVRDVAKPHLGKEAIRPLIKINKISVPVPLLGKTPYEFPSTHPSYIFADLVTILFGVFFYWVGNNKPTAETCAFEYNYLFGHFALWLSLFFPVIRLIFWYVLKKKLSKEDSQKAWLPLIYFWSVILAIVVPALILSRIY